LKRTISKFVRIVLYFVGIGIALAVILYFTWSAPVGLGVGQHDEVVMSALSLLCPGTWMFATCIDCEIGSSPGLFFFVALVVTNALAYAALGAIVAALFTQHPPEEP
jgi:hypothetical protein